MNINFGTFYLAIVCFVYYVCLFFLIKWVIKSKKVDSKKVFIFKLLSVLLTIFGGWLIVFLS